MRWFLNTALLFYLAAAAWKDIREKTVSLRLGMGFGLLAVCVYVLSGQSPVIWLTGMLPGFFLLGTAWLTGQAVGYGDGCVLLVIGLYLGFAAGVSILMAGLLLICPVSLCVFLRKRDRKRTLPFVPFLLAGYLLWLALGGG